MAMRRDMAANIAEGNLGKEQGQARCPGFARILRRFARLRTRAAPFRSL